MLLYRRAMRICGFLLLLLACACPSIDASNGNGEGEGEGEGGTGAAPASCQGDGVDFGEACDGADLVGQSCVTLGYASGPLQCDSLCLFDRRACVAQPDCGDGTLNTVEICEGLELRGETCVDQGRGQGQLSCRDDCTLDFSGCQLCGNGFIEGAETCDGPRIDGQTCASEFGAAATGTLTCNGSCDGVDGSGCELPFGGSCEGDARCAEFRFAAPGTGQSACVAVAGTFSDGPCDIAAAFGLCTTTFASGETPDETHIYFDGDEEASCTSAGGTWAAL